MLNIFKQKTNLQTEFNNNNNLFNNSFTSEIKNCYTKKDYVVSSTEWQNSIYTYNKNYERPLVSYDTIVNHLLKSYFNSYKYNELINIKTNRFKRFRLKRISTDKIFVSKIQSRHTNSKVFITIFTYNQEERNLIHNIDNNNPKFIDIIIRWKKREKYPPKKYLRKMLFLKNKILLTYEQIIKKNVFNTNLLNNNNNNILLDKNFIVYPDIKEYIIYEFLKKEILSINSLNKLYINKSKFKSPNILLLNNLLSKIYGKKVDINIINLKHSYLNNDILLESISLKLRNKKNKLLRVIRKYLSIIKLPESDYFYYNKNYNYINVNHKTKDILQGFLNTNISSNNYTKSKKYILAVLRYINYKPIIGLKINASGRLTKRFTASRSLFKSKYIGTSRNLKSSFGNLSSHMLRGNFKSNLQYCKTHSKTRNGSFGLKGWLTSR